MNRILYFIPALLILTSCLKEDQLKKPFFNYTPSTLEDGWAISSPEAENVDSGALKQIFRDYHADEGIWQVRSLLVFRNGKIIAESYTRDDNDRTTPRAIWSCTKQVTGLLTGVAFDRQILKNIEDPISDYLSETESYPDKQDITIEDLLTMKSGIQYSNDGISGQTDDILRQLPDHLTEFILDRPLDYFPGEQAVYKDCDPQLMLAVIENGCGQPALDWAKEVLFDPLEIHYLDWEIYKDGTTLGGFGILTTPRELGKFGQCVLDSGEWKGNRVISKEWIEAMTTPHVDDLYDFQFGYLWWLDESRDMIFMSGHGGQYCCVIPSKRLVVVMTAEVNTQGDFQFGKEAFEWVDKIVEISWD